MFNKCQVSECVAKAEVKRWQIKGGVVGFLWACADGHTDHWMSSHVLCEKRGQKVFVNTLLMASSILITGNNFEKVNDLFKFLGIGFYPHQLSTESRGTMLYQKCYQLGKK